MALVHKEQSRVSSGASDWNLSEREKSVLTWSAHGKNKPEIGTILGVSPRTVRFHIENAQRKSGLQLVPLVLEHARREFKPTDSWKSTKIVSLHQPLSPREAQILGYYAKGATDSEIARALKIKNRTIHFHVAEAKAKIGVSTRMQAAVAMVFDYPVIAEESKFARPLKRSASLVSLLRRR